jgi:prophage DNA circulation protein
VSGTNSIVESLIPCSFRGIPFGLNAITTKTARATAVHRYPFKDKPWVEDLGAGLTVFSVSGFFADKSGGLLAMVARDALALAVKTAGPGIFTHPTLGVFQCSVLSFSSVESKDAIGAFPFEMELCESTSGPDYPTQTGSTSGSLSLSSLNVLSAAGSDFASTALTYTGLGAAVLETAPGVLAAWSAVPASLTSTAQSIMGSVVGLGDSFGRYADGNTLTAAPDGSTPSSLVSAALANQSAMQTTISTSLASAASGVPANVSAAAVAISGAVLASANDPGDQIDLLMPMAQYFVTATTVGGNLGAGIAAIEAAAAALARVCALAQLGIAVSNYAMTSYDEAVALQQEVVALYDAELQAASDDQRDATFTALYDLRAAVNDYFTALAATLPATEQITLQGSLPALVIAQRLYNDATRTPELIARANPPHPAFMPTTFTALSS